MKRKNILLGISMIAIAVLLVLNSINVIPSLSVFAGEISWITLVILALLIIYIVKTIIKGNFGGIFVALAFAFMLLEENIAFLFDAADKNIINNWLLLASAILLEIGFSLLFKPKKKKHNNKFSSAVTYVDLQNNKNRTFSNKFGELTVRFENIEGIKEDNTIYVYNNFGSMIIEVPADLYCICSIKSKFGELVTPENKAASNSAKLKIEGKNSFGEISVRIV